MRDLAAIQRRFHALVTAGEGTIDPGLLGASRRLEIYADAYVARLHDVLADDHPKLRAALGEDAFRELATSYVRACPPTSFTIRDAGAALPGYLATTGPAWAAELAALERARIEVFDAADEVPWSRDALATVPIERFPELRLGLIAASAAISLAWSVDDVWSAIEDETPWDAPVACARVVLVWRRDLRVVHRTLEADEVALAPLLAVGASLAEVSARLAEVHAAPAQRIVELLGRWLDAGILRRDLSV